MDWIKNFSAIAIVLALGAVLFFSGAFSYFLGGGLDSSEVLLNPEQGGYSFANEGAEKLFVLEENGGTEFLRIKTHGETKCSVAFKDSLVNSVRITKNQDNSYKIACTYGPSFSIAPRAKNESGDYYEEFLGVFQKCTPKAAELFDKGFDANATLSGCMNFKEELGESLPSNLSDYYFISWICNEIKPTDKFYFVHQDGTPQTCFALTEGFRTNSVYSAIQLIVDAETKKIYSAYTIQDISK